MGTYEGLLREVVLRMKSASGESLAWSMGELFATRAALALAAANFDAVTAVPLHWRRRISRGYNQSETLARAAARKLQVPFLGGRLVRSRYTKQQVGLSAAQRRANVVGSFAVRRPETLHGKKVLLIDDVMTTCSTADEACKALRGAGAREVVMGVLAQRTG